LTFGLVLFSQVLKDANREYFDVGSGRS